MSVNNLKKPLKLLSCFSVAMVTWQEELVRPPCMMVSFCLPLCMAWFDGGGGGLRDIDDGVFLLQDTQSGVF